jgi:hypothetical protein
MPDPHPRPRREASSLIRLIDRPAVMAALGGSLAGVVLVLTLLALRAV